MLAQKLRKAAAKIKKANKGKWGTLSTGEKVLKVVLILIKLAIIASLGVIIFAIALACWVAFGIFSGMTDAVSDQIQRSYDYRHRGNYYDDRYYY